VRRISPIKVKISVEVSELSVSSSSFPVAFCRSRVSYLSLNSSSVSAFNLQDRGVVFVKTAASFGRKFVT